MYIFLQLNQYFLYKRKWFFKVLGCLLREKMNIKFLLASLKKVRILKPASEFLFQLFFSRIGQFSNLILGYFMIDFLQCTYHTRLSKRLELRKFPN
jgi:hypothetical protein